MSVEERKRKRECGGEREKEGVRDTKSNGRKLKQLFTGLFYDSKYGL